MKILIACEFSGIVRNEFIKKGHDVISCDLQPTERPGPHYMGNVLDILYKEKWDRMICHPPCDHLAVSGARHFHKKEKQQAEALDFVRILLNAPIEKIALENPISVISTKICKPSQIIQPWMFGHPETKATCLWLKNLPPLYATKTVKPLYNNIHKEPPGPNRKKNRSRTFQGIAEAMAQQWG